MTVEYHPTWRRYGDLLYAILIVLALVAEAAAMATVLIALPLRVAAVLSAERFQAQVVASIVLVGLCVWALGVYALGYHALSERRTRAAVFNRRKWTARWTRILQGEALPVGRLSSDAIAALFELMDIAPPDRLPRLQETAHRYHLQERLRRQLRSVWLSARLEALDALSKARLPAVLPSVLPLIEDPHPSVSILAGRAAARMIAAIPAHRRRRLEAVAFAERIRKGALSQAILEELLLLLWEVAPVTCNHLLHADTAPRLLSVTMRVAAELRLRQFGDSIARFCYDTNPEIRAAALKALAILGHRNRAIAAAVAAGLADPVDFVRVQATGAAALLASGRQVPALRQRLRDRNWWVRRAAARTLAGLGMAGQHALRRVAADADDPFARHIAAQTLLTRGVLDRNSARRVLASA